MSESKPDLSGKTIVITRPLQQASSLAELITASKGTPLLFPVMEIVDPTDTAPLLKLLERLSDFDIAIFISANAVRAAMKFIKLSGQNSATVFTTTKLAVVGNATAKSLASFGLPADIYPCDKFNSEALLAVDELQSVSAKKIIIFRGDGGRELLAKTLRERGASVEYAECYQRIKPATDVTLILAALKAAEINALVVMSNKGLLNLWEMVGVAGQSELQKCVLIVISKRTAVLAQELGFVKKPMIASIASDGAILDVLACLGDN